MQTTARDGIRHVTSQLAVGGAGVKVLAARPVTQGIDFRIWIDCTQLIAVRIALTDNEPLAVKNVLSMVHHAAAMKQPLHAQSSDTAICTALHSWTTKNKVNTRNVFVINV